jgi:hypothetical protein
MWLSLNGFFCRYSNILTLIIMRQKPRSAARMSEKIATYYTTIGTEFTMNKREIYKNHAG